MQDSHEGSHNDSHSDHSGDGSASPDQNTSDNSAAGHQQHRRASPYELVHQVPDQDSTAVVADAAAASARGSNPEERSCSSGGGLGKRARVPSARAQAAAEQAQEDAVAEDEHADTAPEAPSDNSTAMASRGAADEVESDARFSGCAALMAAAEATALADVGESQHDQSSSAGPSGNGSGNSNQRERERPAPFLSKLMQIMETDAQPGGIVYWAETSGEGDASSTSADAQAQAPGGDGSTVSAPAFVISDTATFAKLILPRYFKHNKLSSFIQQLYTYGFRRVPCPDLRQQQQTRLRRPPSHQCQPKPSRFSTTSSERMRPTCCYRFDAIPRLAAAAAQVALM